MAYNKRLPAPKHYPIERKKGTYVSTIEGSRSREEAIPAVLVLRDVLGYAESDSEAKEIIENGDLLRNGERIRDVRQGVGILDVVELPEAEEAYRVLRSGRKLKFVPVDDPEKVIAKITGKKTEGEEYVYNLHNGENYRAEENYTTGNTLLFNSSVMEIELEEGAEVIVIEGQHAGEVAELKKINERGMNADTGTVESDEEFETRLENLVAVENIQLGED